MDRNSKKNQYITGFAVMPKYEIVEINDVHFVKPAHTEEKLEQFNIEDYKIYALDSTSSIYSQFAKVNNEKSLLEFVSQYGMLGISNEVAQLPANLVIVYEPDKVKDCLDAASTIRSLLDMWNNPDKVPETMNVMGKNVNYFQDFIVSSISSLLDGKHFDKPTIVKIYVAKRISEYIEGLKADIEVTSKGEILPTFVYPSLITAIWHQLYSDIIINRAEIKICPYCQSLHTGRKRFCPNPPFSSRSPCENRYHQLKYRKWPIVKQLLEEGHSVVKISQQVKVSQSIINEWIKEGEHLAIKN